jgi:hypothetical protein
MNAVARVGSLSGGGGGNRENCQDRYSRIWIRKRGNHQFATHCHAGESRRARNNRHHQLGSLGWHRLCEGELDPSINFQPPGGDLGPWLGASHHCISSCQSVKLYIQKMGGCVGIRVCDSNQGPQLVHLLCVQVVRGQAFDPCFCFCVVSVFVFYC